MGCGCKNKGNQTQVPAQSTVQTPQQQTMIQAQQTQNASIQESIRKVVEKYYNKK
jgi:hypothetical protein